MLHIHLNRSVPQFGLQHCATSARLGRVLAWHLLVWWLAADSNKLGCILESKYFLTGGLYWENSIWEANVPAYLYYQTQKSPNYSSSTYFGWVQGSFRCHLFVLLRHQLPDFEFFPKSGKINCHLTLLNAQPTLFSGKTHDRKFRWEAENVITGPEKPYLCNGAWKSRLRKHREILNIPVLIF